LTDRHRRWYRITFTPVVNGDGDQGDDDCQQYCGTDEFQEVTRAPMPRRRVAGVRLEDRG
jgi:hypothetical protein